MDGAGLIGFLGGIGLFLFGMEVMTAALRDLAAERLRHWLARFTATPLRGTLTGAVTTAIIQSSTAVSVMTIGFAGAGLITFTQAVAVLYGANIGTTATGWIVTIVGLKLKLGLVALPALFVASIAAIVGGPAVDRWARFVAGLSLLFIGLDVMQGSATGLQAWITPALLPGDGWFGRLALIGIGLTVTMILQSSSAAMALALVLLGSGALTLPQAAAMVIGMNLGTTGTGLLASLGGSRPMRMTAYANSLFNLGTAVVAFPMLALMPTLAAAIGDDQTALVIFHTGFNLLGAALFLPVTAQFAALIERWVPERRSNLSAPLDRALMGHEGAALDAAAAVSDGIVHEISLALGHAVADPPDLRPLAALPARVEPALADFTRWMADLRIAPDHAAARGRFVALMHLTDHMTRLLARAAERGKIAALTNDRALSGPARALFVAMQRSEPAGRMARLNRLIDARAARYRRSTLLREHAGLLDVPQMLQLTDAMRWLERVSDHAERIAHYREMAGSDLK